MALERIMEDAARLAAQGKGADAIAKALGVSKFWVQMVTGTDGFRLAKEAYAKGQGGEDTEGREGDQGEDGSAQAKGPEDTHAKDSGREDQGEVGPAEGGHASTSPKSAYDTYPLGYVGDGDDQA